MAVTTSHNDTSSKKSVLYTLPSWIVIRHWLPKQSTPLSKYTAPSNDNDIITINGFKQWCPCAKGTRQPVGRPTSVFFCVSLRQQTLSHELNESLTVPMTSRHAASKHATNILQQETIHQAKERPVVVINLINKSGTLSIQSDIYNALIGANATCVALWRITSHYILVHHGRNLGSANSETNFHLGLHKHQLERGHGDGKVCGDH